MPHFDSATPSDPEENERMAMAVDREQPPRLAFPVVGIGGSAGGLEAFVELFKGLPGDTGMAFVIVQHLPPERESLIADILANHTVMQVEQVEDGVDVQPDHVYIIRPGRTLTIREGKLHLGELVEKPAHRRPVDDFFRSLASEQRERSICIIMSGMGSNGTSGAQAVKAVGGMCVAQDPASAKFPQMPRSLIEAGFADFILRPEEIPGLLRRYGKQGYPNDAPTPEGEKFQERATLAAILGVIQTRLTLDFTGYKPSTLLRRIRRRMGLHQFTEMAPYATMLRQNSGEVAALADDLMIHVTGFFRDPEVWDLMRTKVIEPLVAERPERQQIRAWVPACATGEEAYTLAILLKEAADAAGKKLEIKVFATDTAEQTLRRARNGLFPGGIETELSPDRLDRFFESDGTSYRVKKELRDLVVFAPHNLLQDPPYSRLDICTCRNLLIYLQPESQERALSLIHFGLSEGGILLLGTSETTAGTAGMYEVVDKKHRIFRRVGPTRHGIGDFPSSAIGARFLPGTPRATSFLRSSVEQITHETLLRRFAPPTVVFNRQGDIAFFHGDTAKFFDQQRGVPTRQLLAMARGWVKAAVWAAMQKSLAENQSVTVQDSHTDSEGKRLRLEITVAPLTARSGPEALFFMSFVERTETFAPDRARGAADSRDPSELEEELRQVRGELQATTEQLQTLLHEMKAADQEATSVNEELQSVNEEMETSREELQSLNEELTTVNAQLRTKMEEYEATSSDLSSLLTSTAVAVVFLDSDFHIRRFTPAARDLFDLIPADVGRPLSALARLFVDEHLLSDAQVVLNTLVPREKEVKSISGRFYVRRIHPYRTGENRIEGVVVTFLDVTELKRAELALGLTERRQRLILESVKEYAIFMVTDEGKIETWSTAAELVFGYDSAQVIGRGYDLVYPAPDRELGIPAARLAEARARGRSTEERWYVGPDGKRFWGSGMLYSLKDTEGALSGFVAVVRDATEQRLTSEAENDSRRVAEQANEMKDHFLANVSHELRTPLSAMMLWANVIAKRDNLPSAQFQEGIRAILKCAEEQHALIEDLVDTSRIAAGKLRLERKPTQLNDVLRTAVEAIRPAAEHHRIALESHLDPLAGMVLADPHRLHQVIWNLLTNAVKFSERGGKITVECKRKGSDVEITVTDTGRGIAPEMLMRVFERFGQGEPVAGRTRQGLGLGLAIAHQLVELHQGSIKAESAGVGMGATFRVVLPLPVVTEAELRQAESGAPMDIKYDLSDLHVLLVEDSEDTRNAMVALLQDTRATVSTAETAAEALETFKQSPFDVVLSDIGLPDDTGYELIRKIREWEAAEKLPAVPAMAITAYANDLSRQRALASGFHVSFAKPLNPPLLLAALAKVKARMRIPGKDI